MLRAKQVGQVSQYARYFFINGSRNTVDGNSYSGPEDETYASRKQQRNNKFLHQPKASTLASDISTRVGAFPYGDGVATIGHHKSENSVCHSSAVHAVPSTKPSLVSECERTFDKDFSAKERVLHSTNLGDHNSGKARLASVASLSKLVPPKAPIAENNGKFVTPHSSLAGSLRPAGPPNSKPAKKENCKPRETSSVQTGGSNGTAQFNDTKGRVKKSASVTSTDRVSGRSVESSARAYNGHSDAKKQKQNSPQASRANTRHLYPKSNQHISETADGSFFEELTSVDLQKPQESTGMRAKTATSAGQSPNAGHLVEHVYHLLERVSWGPAAEAALGNLKCTLGAYHGNQILKRLQNHSVAHGFFYWLKRQPGFKHDEHSYTTMVGILGRARQFDTINRLLDEMVEDGVYPNVVTYNRLIHSYGRANYLEESINVFYEMQEAGCQPDRVTYCTLIDIHAKAGFLDVALDMYQKMQEAGLTPDTFTYSVMINCLGKSGNLNASYKLFCDMIDNGCVPNLVTYNIMIALQAKARNYPCAIQLYHDMVSAGFEPDKVTYSIIMEVLGHCGNLEEVEALFMEMKQKNWVPDEPVYGLLVDLFGKAGEVDKARKWYQAMLDAGIYPNVPTCNSLVSAYLRVHRFSDAYNLLESMPGLGLNPSLQTYTLLLSSCSDMQYGQNIDLRCDLMAVTHHPAHAFLQSMPAAGPDGQNVREHANTFLNLMHSEDLESKRGLVDAVVDFLHKSGLKEEASSVWEVASEKNVYPDAVKEKSSCYWLINLHVMSDGTAITALSRTLAWFHRQMVMTGVGPIRIDIVTGWGRRSRVTGSSMVRQSVKELLHIFEFPFSTENGNTGCFVGRGDPLNRWLLNPCVERMHLL